MTADAPAHPPRRFSWRAVVLSLTLALVLWLPRGLALDHFVAVDERSWLTRSGNFYLALSQGDWAATFQRYHPGVTTMWLGMLGFLWRYPDYPADAAGQITSMSDGIEGFLQSHGHPPLTMLAAGADLCRAGDGGAVRAGLLARRGPDRRTRRAGRGAAGRVRAVRPGLEPDAPRGRVERGLHAGRGAGLAALSDTATPERSAAVGRDDRAGLAHQVAQPGAGAASRAAGRRRPGRDLGAAATLPRARPGPRRDRPGRVGRRGRGGLCGAVARHVGGPGGQPAPDSRRRGRIRRRGAQQAAFLRRAHRRGRPRRDLLPHRLSVAHHAHDAAGAGCWRWSPGS